MEQALGYSVWLGLMALAAGGVAFALAPFLGRGAAAGIAGFVTFAGFILNGYQEAVPQLAPYANLTWWGWTQNHLPLAGPSDWPSVALLFVVVVILFVIGVEAFARRDIGGTSTIVTPSMPHFLLGLSGPVSRATSLSFWSAIAWGLGVGLFGLVFGSAAGPFMDQMQPIARLPEVAEHGASRAIDYASAGGFLQLLFVEIGRDLRGPRRGDVRERLGI